MNDPPAVDITPKVRSNDPQITLEGVFKHGPQSDIITFSLRFLLFELAFIVVIPEEHETRAPVYLKCKLLRRMPSTSYR
jgi:hypothetical protein